jgi:3-phenylpropionate/trans-cinnamate dioxygenase ferredoxin reductase subunit
MDAHHDVVIVGGGQAGAQAAVLLRQQGFAGTIAMIGEEPELPYDRPPLSKEYLAGKKRFDQLVFRTARAWEALGVAIHLKRRVVAIDPEARRVRTADGAAFGYGALIWAAGGSPRALACPGAEARGIHAVRTRADVDAILAGLDDAGQVAIVGGGYIGLETAAALRELGRPVIVLEAQDRVLARVAGEPLARFYEAEHRARGVEIRLGVAVECIEHDNGAVRGVRLADGELVPARMVIVGIGIQPEIAPLGEAGAETGNGVRVDALCRTSLPGVYALGDCAEHRNPFAHEEWTRLESIQNANDQAMTVAKAICGIEAPYHALPWFWSNQYDLKLQTVGLSQGHDDLVVRGDPASRSFSTVYFRKGRVVALDCVNSVRDYSHGRALIAAGVAVDRDKVADATIQLRSLIEPR